MIEYENCSQIGVAMEKKRYDTAGRRALAGYLKDTAVQAPQTAEEIVRGLRAAGATVGKSSVYRMLAEMSEVGQVRKFTGVGERATYQYAGEGDCHGHLHLQCLSCGRVSHLKCGCGSEIAAHLQRAHGFVVDQGHSVLYGTCAECAAGEVRRD